MKMYNIIAIKLISVPTKQICFLILLVGLSVCLSVGLFKK